MNVANPLCISLVALLVACSGDEDTTPVDTQPPATGPGGTIGDDTGWPPGDLGNIVVSQDERGSILVYAVFAGTGAPNFLNLAKCAIDGTVCLNDFSNIDEDDIDTFDPDLDVDQEAIRTRYLGYEITIGEWTLTYREDPDTKFGYYSTNGTDIGLPEDGWLGATWGGQWPEYESTADLFVPEPIELLSPRNDGFKFPNGEPLTIEWVPTGEGFVTLLVIPTFGDAYVFHLNDDGLFNLDTTLLGLFGSVEDLQFVLSRWTHNTTFAFGHVVDWVSVSDVGFSGQMLNVGGRTEVFPSDACDQAIGGVGLTAGNYWGRIEGPMQNDLNPTGCVFAITNLNGSASGPEGVFRIDVEPRHQIAVDYNVFEESASVYLLSKCDTSNPDAVCLDGADDSDQDDTHEFVGWFNPTDDPVSIYLGLDMSAAPEDGGTFTLDVTDITLDEPTMWDTCAEAEAEPPLFTPGSYWATKIGYGNDLNPGSGGCTGSVVDGPEAMTRIEIPPLTTATISVEMLGANPAVYLLSDCNDPFQCLVGNDSSGNTKEQVVYENLGNYPLSAYVVVDTVDSALAPYFLTITY